jgi:hypothetical protein
LPTSRFKESETKDPQRRPAAAKRGRPSDDGASERPVDFAHESERQFARLLDFYRIEWEYEPHTFDVEWDEDGNVIKRFTPDFYLPDFDLHIEITTLNQKLVTKKNRKVRRLRELYPEVKVKIFYQRDYLRLLQKYGLAKPSRRKESSAVE